ncbi:hypothetical protein LAZ67_11002044 [Cordylochernes scorpioides]|uniref:Uncharacterized protein n=1 Tax=Cordylochernes scorpioides TaxID=51811 RepID=A0ABY6KZE9_9ARAC|nr:hypothetical protein LAZ67_11002044 [Cordylochernes scorpioides]
MPRRSRPLIGRNTAASRRYRNAIAIETPLQSETRRALRRLRYSEARVAAAQTMQVPVQRIQLWTHKPFSGLQYNTHIDYKADSSVDIGQMSQVCQFCSALRFRDEPFGLCCKQGRVSLPAIESPPEPIFSLLSGLHPLSKSFLLHIRRYNSIFQMTSFGARQVVTNMPRRSRPLIGRNTAASRRYRNAIAIETPLQSETRRALRRLRYSEARVAAAQTMQVPVQRIQLWTHKPFSGLQYNTHIDYKADSSVDIGQMSRVCQFCSALRFRNEPFGLCCKQGRVSLPAIESPPEPIFSLLSGLHPLSKSFLLHIRRYNSIFQMTSFGARQVVTNMPRRSRPLIGRNTAASRRYRNAIAIETPLQSETRRALRRLRYSEARVAAAQTMQVPVQRIQLWTHKPFSGLQYNTHIDYKADSSVDIGQMSRVCQFCSALRFRNEPFGLCCKQGRVSLPAIESPPEPIFSLLSGLHPLSKSFLLHIRRYNSIFQMTSFGARQVVTVNMHILCEYASPQPTFIGRNTAASRRYRNAIAIETPLQSETRRALRRLRYSEARVAAAQTMQVPVQRIQLWTHKPFSGLQYNTHIDYKADSSVDIGQISRVCQFCSALRFRNEPFGLCCKQGRVSLPAIESPPEPIFSLLSGLHPLSKSFLLHIRRYNSIFQMTSFGARQVVTIIMKKSLRRSCVLKISTTKIYHT